ncbi:hypothetical protein L6164_036172 [Bauhinia variegata]|nr:hypothetical protein L6164_036172 [Bauhinia variegata]
MEPAQALDFSSTVDTSRPFSSVKEAVAIFGERFLAGEIYPPKPFMDITTKQDTHSQMFSPSPMKPKEDNDNNNNKSAFSDTLKKLEAELEETKVELKLIKEREGETKVALATLNAELHKNISKLVQADQIRDNNEEKKRDQLIKDSQTLAQIMSLGENYGKRKVMKKKPIIPLVGDLFSKKKGSATTPLHASPFFYN